MAFGDAAEGESAVVCVATGDVAEGEVISENQDSRDAKVSQTWKQRFAAFFTDFPQQLTTALPGIAELRHDQCDEAQVNLKPDASGPPCKRPYKQSSEAARQLRDRLEVLVGKGYIRPSSSPYAAPCLMVPRPGDPKTLRLVVDYRHAAESADCAG